MPNLFSRFNVISQSQHDAEIERGHPPLPPVVRQNYFSQFLRDARPNVTTIPDDDPEFSLYSPSGSKKSGVLANGDSSGWISRRSIGEQEEFQAEQKMKRLRVLNMKRDAYCIENVAQLKVGAHVWTRDKEIEDLSLNKKGSKGKRRSREKRLVLF